MSGCSGAAVLRCGGLVHAVSPDMPGSEPLGSRASARSSAQDARDTWRTARHSFASLTDLNLIHTHRASSRLVRGWHRKPRPRALWLASFLLPSRACRELSSGWRLPTTAETSRTSASRLLMSRAAVTVTVCLCLWVSLGMGGGGAYALTYDWMCCGTHTQAPAGWTCRSSA